MDFDHTDWFSLSEGLQYHERLSAWDSKQGGVISLRGVARSFGTWGPYIFCHSIEYGKIIVSNSHNMNNNNDQKNKLDEHFPTSRDESHDGQTFIHSFEKVC